MQFKNVGLAVAAFALVACGGGETATSETPAATTPAATTTPAAPAGAALATAPITGKTIEVKMVGDAKGYRFEPATITAKVGDAIKFIAESGFPHNIAFDPAMIPAEARAQLDANFHGDKMGELSSGLKSVQGESITISLGGLVPGKYEFNCTPHLAMNMKGTLTITP